MPSLKDGTTTGLRPPDHVFEKVKNNLSHLRVAFFMENENVRGYDSN
nr:MAG TPA: hypothetical protein [Caudoviricetes sp.]